MEYLFERVLVGAGKYEYQLTRGGQLLGKAYPRKGLDSDHRGGFSLEGFSKNYFLSVKNVYGEKFTEDNITFKGEAATIMSDGQADRMIYQCIKRGKHLFDGIGITEVYWEDGNVYSQYQVGFGHKGGIYLCIYRNEELVAEIMLHKKYGVKTTYTFYTKEDVPIELLVISTIFWDIINWFEYDAGYAFQFKSGWYTLNTWVKEELEKFDPNFIERYRENTVYVEPEKKPFWRR